MYACDSFNRADTGSLGTAVNGGAWQVRSGTGSFGICSQRACASSVGGEGSYAALSTGISNHNAQINIYQGAGVTGTSGVVVRARSAWDRFILVEATEAGQILVWRWANNNWALLDATLVTLATNPGYNTLRVVAHVSTIAVEWGANGAAPTHLLSVADTDDATGTYAGIYWGPQHRRRQSPHDRRLCRGRQLGSTGCGRRRHLRHSTGDAGQRRQRQLQPYGRQPPLLRRDG